MNITKETKEWTPHKSTEHSNSTIHVPPPPNAPANAGRPCGCPEDFRLVLVDDGAVLPDLALGPGLDLDGAHLHHGAREHLEEELGRRVHGGDDVGLGRRVGDERGVGLEQAPALEQAAVVAEVEGPEAPRVHLHDGGVVRRRRALGPAEVRRVRRVQRRVRVAGAAAPGEVVEALREGVAVRDADGVTPCIRKPAGERCRLAATIFEIIKCTVHSCKYERFRTLSLSLSAVVTYAIGMSSMHMHMMVPMQHQPTSHSDVSVLGKTIRSEVPH